MSRRLERQIRYCALILWVVGVACLARFYLSSPSVWQNYIAQMPSDTLNYMTVLFLVGMQIFMWLRTRRFTLIFIASVVVLGGIGLEVIHWYIAGDESAERDFFSNFSAEVTRDKLLHVTSFLCVTAPGCIWSNKRHGDYLIILGVMVFLGIGLEGVQGLVLGREQSVADAFANMIGIWAASRIFRPVVERSNTSFDCVTPEGNGSI